MPSSRLQLLVQRSLEDRARVYGQGMGPPSPSSRLAEPENRLAAAREERETALTATTNSALYDAEVARNAAAESSAAAVNRALDHKLTEARREQLTRPTRSSAATIPGCARSRTQATAKAGSATASPGRTCTCSKQRRPFAGITRVARARMERHDGRFFRRLGRQFA